MFLNLTWLDWRVEKPVAMILVDGIGIDEKNKICTASADIHVRNRNHRVWFRWPGPSCRCPADAYLIVSLCAAMRLGVKLVVRGYVSERLLSNVRKIQEIYHCWDRELSIVDVEVDGVRPWNPLSPPRNAGLTGSAFTGGVDSFYMVLKRLEEISALVYVHGLDLRMGDHSLRKRVSQSLKQAATRLGKEFWEVETNLRDYSDNYMKWFIACGGALASVGVFLSGRLSKFTIASGQSYTRLISDGAHPVLFPLFSTDLIDFEVDGCEATRVEKVEAISQNTVVMDTLRVCWENRDGDYNCCRCEKCLRTMASLKIVGALEQCKTFKHPFDYECIARIVPVDEELKFFTLENIEASKRMNADPRLLDALQKSLNVKGVNRILSRSRATIQSLVRRLRMPHWGKE